MRSKRKHKKLSIAWIDYQKAFDSVPNSWVEKSTEVIGAKSKMFRFCKLSMEKWKTRLHFKTKQEVIQSQPIQVKRDFFRGLSFATILLYNIYSIKKYLNRADGEYQVRGTERKITQLLYMDDLELLGRSKDDLEKQIKIAKAISKAININFRLEKCARICLKKVWSKAKHN
jgi:hypothetical protein